MPSAMRSTLFGMGFSWGGYESLVILFDCAAYRTATHMVAGRAVPCASISDWKIPSDLIADLEQGFAAMKRAM